MLRTKSLTLHMISVFMFYIAQSTISNAEWADHFRRGVNIHEVMNWATLEAPAYEKFVYPPFADSKHALRDETLSEIRRGGFDSIRLTVDPGPFLQFKGKQRDTLDLILKQRLTKILSAGLSVIVDFHPNTELPEYRPTVLLAEIDSALFNGYCDMLGHTAALLEEFHSDRVSLELMNEPKISGVYPGTDALWQRMLEKLYKCSRARAPNIPVILSGGRSGGPDALELLDPTPFQKDTNAIFTFHYYDPFYFTSQSILHDTATNLLADVPYPALSRPLEDSLTASKNRLETQNMSPANRLAGLARARKMLLQYRSSAFDNKTIERTFDGIAKWADDHKIARTRIFVGEFGVMRTYSGHVAAREPERLQWLRDVRTAANSHAFSWAIWAYHDPVGMGITTDDESIVLDPSTIEALDLKAQP